jgi:hypothetical protein
LLCDGLYFLQALGAKAIGILHTQLAARSIADGYRLALALRYIGGIAFKCFLAARTNCSSGFRHSSKMAAQM